MFSKATANFVHQIDPEGSLIHVSRVNDSKKLVSMALVVKRNRFWFWQRPKYQPTDFTLSDLLLGDKELSPGLTETDFLTYEGTFQDELFGKLRTKAASVSMAVEGRGTSKLQSCFGKLKKEELDVKKLLHDSRNRLVDMQHQLVRQLEKRADVLGIVKERIITTNSCSITQTKKEQCMFKGVLGLLDILGSSVQVCLKDTNNIEMDSDVSLEIPSDTVIAYSILELEIKKNGDYDICLQSGAKGGFESDSSIHESIDSFCVVDGKFNGENPALQNGSEEMDLSPLAELDQATRRALFKTLQETMRDRTVLSYLQCELEKLCRGDSLDMAKKEMERHSLDSRSEGRQVAGAAKLKATHLLVSAMEELPDETLSLLSESPADFLQAFNTLMCRLKESSGHLPIQQLPVPLQDNQTFQQAEQLLSSTSVTLKRDTDRLWMETGEEAGALPLVLCLSTRGLSLLGSGLK